jgi:hypothetical protein
MEEQMIHTCTICNRTKECDPRGIEPCTLPQRIAMNCIDDITKMPYHQEEYLKTLNLKKWT